MPDEYKLPNSVVIGILILTLIPVCMAGMNVDLGLSEKNITVYNEKGDPLNDTEVLFPKLAGPFVHTILEWTAFGVALSCSLLSLMHFLMKRDVTTPIIGAALFSSGMLDAFSTLAANRLLFQIPDPENFFPFTWAMSRTFYILILMSGAFPFIWGRYRTKAGIRAYQSRPVAGVRYFILMGVLFALMSYATIYIFAVVVNVPKSSFPNWYIKRPWDTMPLMLMVLAWGIVFPRFMHRQRSVFSHSLIISMAPAICAQIILVLGSRQLYDSCFINAYFLKIIAYAVPLCGLIIDYIRAYKAELLLQKTASKLEAARHIQEKLLPLKAPEIPGFDIAGCSHPAEAVGGDYFDYVRYPNGALGMVVGDVSGHDLGASLFMTQTRAYFRALVENTTQPADSITKLNQLLTRDTRDLRFVTYFLLVLDQTEPMMEYVGAGHQGYLLKTDGTLQILDASNPPLGISDKDMESNLVPIPELGEIIIIPTDGILEATPPRSKELFGEARMARIIHQHRHLPSQEIVEHLYNAVLQYTSPLLPTDDLTVVLIKRNRAEVNLFTTANTLSEDQLSQSSDNIEAVLENGPPKSIPVTPAVSATGQNNHAKPTHSAGKNSKHKR
jgi:hypothetical protein